MKLNSRKSQKHWGWAEKSVAYKKEIIIDISPNCTKTSCFLVYLLTSSFWIYEVTLIFYIWGPKYFKEFLFLQTVFENEISIDCWKCKVLIAKNYHIHYPQRSTLSIYTFYHFFTHFTYFNSSLHETFVLTGST